MHLIALLQQEVREVAAVLAGYSGDERATAQRSRHQASVSASVRSRTALWAALSSGPEMWSAGPASRHAHQFSWDRSMEALFGQLYRDALLARSSAVSGDQPARAALARAA